MASEYREDPNAQEHIERLFGKTLDELLPAIASDAKRLAPVDTGELRSKIDYEKLTPTHGRVFANTKYAAAVERGHVTRSGSHVPAQPYLRPAVTKNRGGTG
jgi:hypothetical protein